MDFVMLGFGLSLFFGGIWKLMGNGKSFFIPAVLTLVGAGITLVSAWEVL